MGNIASILEALIAGYLVAVLLQTGLGYLITREGRGVLMQGDCMSRVYYMQIGAAWLISSAAASVVVLQVMKATPAGLAIAGAVGLLLIFLVLRNHLKTPYQQTLPVNFLLFLCIAAGTALGCILRMKAS